jgi:hypothetical protein
MRRHRVSCKSYTPDKISGCHVRAVQGVEGEKEKTTYSRKRVLECSNDFVFSPTAVMGHRVCGDAWGLGCSSNAGVGEEGGRRGTE